MQLLTESIKLYAKHMRKRVRNDKDLVVALSCALEEGSGKSTLAILLGMACDPAFTLTSNELYSPNETDVKEKITNLPRYSVVIADEAINILYKLRWASPIQIFLNKLYALCRKENKITFLCMPRFTDFNEFFRNHKIKIWIEILERGTAVVFAKDWSPFAKDPWWIDDNQKLIDKSRKKRKFTDFSVDEKLGILSKSKNYVGVIKWDKLPTEIWSEYEKQRDAVKYKDLVEEKDQKIKEKKLYDTIASLVNSLNKVGLSQGEIGKITGYSQVHIGRILKKGEKQENKPLS